VVQQREGRVKPTNKQQSSYAKASEVNEGMPVNTDPSLEKEADELGRYAAQGKSVRVSNSAQQEKVQMKRDLPPANVIDLEIDKSKVIDSFSELWENRPEKYNNKWFFDTPAKFKDHPYLSTLVNSICGGTHFYGKNTWNSGWLDDGDLDILWGGDAEVKAEIHVFVDNEQVIDKANVDTTTGGEYSTSHTNSSSTTTGVKGTIGAGAKGVNAGVEAGVSHTDGTKTTNAAKGSVTNSINNSTKIIVGDIKMRIKLSFKPYIGGPPGLQSVSTETPVVGKVKFHSSF
jgi:hypothetical protein